MKNNNNLIVVLILLTFILFYQTKLISNFENKMNHSNHQNINMKNDSGSNPCTDKLTDLEYLEHMIPHHQVAIDMSKRLLLHTNHTYLLDFCRKLIIDQQSEIYTMNNLLKIRNYYKSGLLNN